MRHLVKTHELDIEWISIKLSLITIWSSIMCVMINEVHRCIYPVGICRIYSFDPLFTPIGKCILYALMILSALAYLLEKKMVLTTFALFLISLIVISFHESNGIFYRATVLSPIWAVQSLAYWQYQKDKSFDLKYYRQQYVWQIIATVYALAGISKIYHSGLDWVNGGPQFALQMIKNYAYQYFDKGDLRSFDETILLINKTLESPILLKAMLTFALTIELSCFAVLLGKRYRMFWGTCLSLMHLGIAYMMGIGISVVAFPMIIFFINPLFYFFKLINKISTQDFSSE